MVTRIKAAIPGNRFMFSLLRSLNSFVNIHQNRDVMLSGSGQFLKTRNHAQDEPQPAGKGLGAELLGRGDGSRRSKNAFAGRLLKVDGRRCVLIKLEVHWTNDRTVALYRKAGFDTIGDYEVFIIRDLTIID
jgi:hypothetical protein